MLFSFCSYYATVCLNKNYLKVVPVTLHRYHHHALLSYLKMAEIIYRHGDLWLELNGARYLVSSTVLAVSSEYFHMLFNSGFAESQQTFNNPARPAHIRLEEADNVSMSILLKLVHHQYQILTTGVITVATLPGLCILADEYLWMPQLRPLLQMFLTNYLPDDIYSRNIATALLIASYMLQEGKIFRKASAWLVQKELGAALRDFPDAQDVLPSRVHCKSQTHPQTTKSLANSFLQPSCPGR